MAGAFNTPPFLFTTPTLKPLCTLITPRPRKLTTRKNYLRLKILKTLTKPYPNPLEKPHILPSELNSPENQELRLPEVSDPAGADGVVENTFSETPFQQNHILNSQLNALENQELRLMEPAGVVNASAGTFSKSSLVKFGLWVVGAFVFQTIFAVWVLGSAESLGRNDEVLELDSKGKSKYKMRMFVNGDGKRSTENEGIVFVDEAAMEKKIEEIQHMAREAREKERLKSKGSNFDEESEDEIEDSDVKIGIKKEVGERLMKLRKRPEKVSNKQPTDSVAYPMADVEKNDRGGNLDEKRLNDALMFKRKHKFRDFSGKPSNKPKGFMAPDHQSVGTNGEKNLKGKTKVLTNGNGEIGVNISSEKSNRSRISRMKEMKDQKVVKPNGVTKSRNDTDFWWSSLPYVLVIRMQRGHDGEGAEGLFALKSSSQVNGGSSHTVAFEDRGDATNFCYLLQSFFEDLGDFSAEILPLPVKELSEAIRSHTMKVIVVKKGKLKLYAGQPLAEAEMALRSLVEQQ